MTAADRPSDTDLARAAQDLADHFEDLADSLDGHVTHEDVHRLLLEGLGMARALVRSLAAGRAETTTATTEDAFTRSAVAVRIIDSCLPDDLPIDLYPHAVKAVKALADAGLLATARTRTGREQIAQAITSGFLGTKHSSEFWKKGTARNAQDNYLRAADAVLALLSGGESR